LIRNTGPESFTFHRDIGTLAQTATGISLLLSLTQNREFVLSIYFYAIASSDFSLILTAHCLSLSDSSLAF